MKNFSLFQLMVLGLFGLLAMGGLIVFLTYSFNSEQKPSILVWTDVVDVKNYLEQNHSDDYESVTVREFAADDFVSQVVSELSLGKQPDVILTSVQNQFVLGERIRSIPSESLSEVAFTERYVSGANDLFRTSDGYSGIPLAVDPLVLYSNEVKLNNLGIALPPTYWDEVSQLTNLYAKRTGDNVIDPIIPLGLAQNVNHAQAIFDSMLGQVGSVPIVYANDRYQSGIDSNQATQVLNYFTDFANPDSGVYNWNAGFSSARQVFLEDDAVFYLGYASEAADLAELNPNIVVRYSEFPQIRDARKYVEANYVGGFVPVVSQNFSPAVTYLASLAQDNEFLLLLGQRGYVSAQRSSLASADPSVLTPLTTVAGRSAIYSGSWPNLYPDSARRTFTDLIDSVQYRDIPSSRAISDYSRTLERSY